MGTEHSEPRGALDLAQLWRQLPVGVLRYPLREMPSGAGLASLGDVLRARAWRTHCAAAVDTTCVDLSRACQFANCGRCRADVLFPMQPGGGAPQWRMATLFVQWLPGANELRIVALGDTACAEIGWVARVLRERYDFGTPHIGEARSFADLELKSADRWRITFVTPWAVAKARRGKPPPPDRAGLAREIFKSMASRAQKFTALCAREEPWQRIAAHLACYAAAALLREWLRIEEMDMRAHVLPIESRGNARRFDVLVWSGEAVLHVASQLLPWLTLIALCGGGENADKGFGAVEIVPAKPASILMLESTLCGNPPSPAAHPRRRRHII